MPNSGESQLKHKPKIVFFGSSEFSAQIVKVLADKYDLSLVVTQPERTAGRKAVLTPTAVAVIAANLGLKTIKPQSLKSEETFNKIKEAAADIFVVVAYGKIIQGNILGLAKSGSLNIHGSLLPKYRGASPIHAALLHSDNKTGISIMLMDEQMDHGPVLVQKEVTIDPKEMFPALEQKLCETATELILQTIPEYLSGQLQPREQDHSKATYCGMIRKEDGKIDWSQDSYNIFNRFRAFIVWPGIWTLWQGKILKIIDCEPLSAEFLKQSIKTDADFKSNSGNVPGLVKYIDSTLYVQCRKGGLKLMELQLEGKNKLSAHEFVKGRRSFIGAELGF